MKVSLWEVSGQLRPELHITLRRVQNYTNPKDEDAGKVTGYRTELYCLGKTLNVSAPTLENSALWALGQWITTLDKVMAKHELASHIMKPNTVNDPDSFVRAIMTTEIYKEKFLEKTTQPESN